MKKSSLTPLWPEGRTAVSCMESKAVNCGVVSVQSFVSGDFSIRKASTPSKGTVLPGTDGVMEPNKHGIHRGIGKWAVKVGF